jgi:hypothetical protein
MASFVPQDKLSELCESSTESEIPNRHLQNNFGAEAVLENAVGDSELLSSDSKISVDSDECKLLRAKISDLEFRCSNLIFENEKTNIE